MGSAAKKKGVIRKSLDWVMDRFALKPIEQEVVRHRVTKTRWYYGDGSALAFLFTVLVTTGAFLGLTYSPSPASAYESVVQITRIDRLGWFVRALHYWSAGAMLLVMLHHVFRQLLLGGYLPPREGTWLVGVAMLFLVIINSFTGYTLRWDERAVYAIRVALNIFYQLPFIGDEVVRYVQGGWTIAANTLTRMYAVHVLFVPLTLFALVGYHLYLVIVHGETTIAEQKLPVETADEQRELRDAVKNNPRTGEEFYPHTAARSGGFALVVFCTVLGLAWLVGPAELYPKASFATDSFPIEEWWFHWYSAMAALLPPVLAPVVYVTLPVAVLLALVVLPFIDHGANRGARRRPLAIVTVSLVLFALFGLTGLRFRSSWTAWPTKELVPLPAQVTLADSAAHGHQLFTKRGCFNCHAVGGNGPKFAPNLSELKARLSREELRRYILNPPEGVAMPSYQSVLSDTELERLVDFVLAAQTFPRKY